MNNVSLVGRITADPELRHTQSGIAMTRFTLAVDRRIKSGEEKQADFITIVAWRQQAEFISKYFGKGRMIAIEGNLRTRTYDDKNGVKHYVTEVYVDSVSFTGEAKQGGYSNSYSNNNYQPQQSAPVRTQPENNNDNLSIGDLADYEDVLSDDGVPF